MKRVLFACGGTGGHVYPAIALAEAWESQGHGEAHFAGRAASMESRLVGTRWPFHEIVAWPLTRGRLVANLLLPVRLVRSAISACRAVRRLRPDLVVGTGGYVSLPVLFAAKIYRIPFILQEQNAVAGVANRVASRWAKVAFLADEAASRSFKCRVVISGNPVRPLPVDQTLLVPEQYAGAKEKILVLGGSQGAKGVNERLLAALEKMNQRSGLAVVWQTGPAQYEEMKSAVGSSANVYPVAFIDGVYPYLQHADLVICRAGASTLAEVTAFGRASILIPYPYAAANHQVHNAQALEERGAAVVELESEPDRLWEKVEKILGDRELRTKMADAARSMGHPNSAIEIVTQIAQEMAS